MKNVIDLTIDDNGIAQLKMNDVESKNLFSHKFVDQLVNAFDDLEEKQPKVCILSGLSDVFSGGAVKDDLMDLCDGKVHVKDLVISEKIINSSFPVIAAMEGHAVGGGLVMASCCDIVIAAKESRYGVVFMSLGFTPGMGCTELLQDLMGPFVAHEMMMTGKRFRGSELAQKGTNINYIVPKEEVITKAEDVAFQIAEKNIKSIYLLQYALSAEKKKKLVDARVQEDFMHRLSFSFPETKKNIKDQYA